MPELKYVQNIPRMIVLIYVAGSKFPLKTIPGHDVSTIAIAH